MNIVNLKTCPQFIDQYIELRNARTEMLLTSPVNKKDTEKWLKDNEIELLGLEEDNMLEGIVILYIEKGGEVSFFSKLKNKGTGTKLLNIIEHKAKERNIREIYAWVREDNLIAIHVFLKCGYLKTRSANKEFKGNSYSGFIFTKKLGIPVHTHNTEL